MTGKHSILTAVAVLCCASIVAGCNSGRGRTGDKQFSGTSINTQQDGDKPLGQQPTEFGIPVTGVSFENVLFEFDKASIRRSEYAKMDSVATYLKRNSKTRVVLDGYCDERGTAEYNLSLGERRSIAVRDYIVELGVMSDRVFTRSFGEEKPLNPEHNEAAWRENRRVEFSLYR